MNKKLACALGATTLLLSVQAAAQVTFYEHDNFRGRTFGPVNNVSNFERTGFNDRASSAVVERGRWEVCSDANFGGNCVVLRPGSYDNLERMGLNDRVSSVRKVSGNASSRAYRDSPEPLPVYEYRRRPNEKLYEANVTKVRAVVGDAQQQQRCWVEKEEVRADGSVGGAVVGAILGGVLGHQIGSGKGNDAATALGAIGGGALGYNKDRIRGGTETRDVQRCENVASSYQPQYYDVTYNFRNREHHAQLAAPPGRTITVNQNGEPRG
ncbi:beta/gamma crystallin-related protein [Usitatibacter palustris]|uniref:Beta/gamma crystallin 'Greek key' domain-containing protein n=1 Tax=Usitatibacter palustris TaxID=2732487 RepID=A0A6M4H6G6_9PROT|nr:beta/gamma crystallin-related protein [Usitatibacter palustris]QJR15229.1 hypothetical protein DSM104440_02046 [Usitatibacter palustris]